MSAPDHDSMEERVLVLAPTARDAALTRRLLDRAEVASAICVDLRELVHELERGAAALLLTDDTVAAHQSAVLKQALSRQPAWSDLPVLVLVHNSHGSTSDDLSDLGNVTLLDRPVRVAMLVSAVKTALRSRRRQYLLREQISAL